MSSRIKSVLPLILVFSTFSCVIRPKIEVAGQHKVTEIPAYTNLPYYYWETSIDPWNKYYGEQGFQVLVLSSNRDLEEIIEKYDMYNFGYEISICGVLYDDRSFGRPVFPATPDDLKGIGAIDPSRTYYLAYLPVQYNEDLPVAEELEAMEEAMEQIGACLRLRASMMIGLHLRTNKVNVAFPVP